MKIGRGVDEFRRGFHGPTDGVVVQPSPLQEVLHLRKADGR